MVAGYPGLTFRSYTEAEMRERAELFYPRRAELFRTWIDLMEAASKKDDAARIALADRIKSLANQEKNARGQVDGIRRGHILEKKTASEREILAWAAARPEQKEALAAHDELARPDRRAAADVGPRFPAEPGEIRPQAARSGADPGALGGREGEARPGA